MKQRIQNQISSVKSSIVWNGAKFGWWLISLWIKDQYEIDGDFVQVEEILKEFISVATAMTEGA